MYSGSMMHDKYGLNKLLSRWREKLQYIIYQIFGNDNKRLWPLISS